MDKVLGGILIEKIGRKGWKKRFLLVLGIFWKVKQVYHHSGKSLLAIIIVCMLSHILFSGHYNDEKEKT